MKIVEKETVRELRLTMKLSNNRMRQRREEMGYLSRRQAALAVGINVNHWRSYEALTETPLTTNGQWKPSAVRIATALQVTPDWLWPKDVLEVVQPKVVQDVDAAELQALYSPLLSSQQPVPLLPSEAMERQEEIAELRKAMAGLSPIEQDILILRSDGETFGEISAGPGNGRSVARLAQIEQTAFRKLRRRLGAIRRRGHGSRRSTP